MQLNERCWYDHSVDGILDRYKKIIAEIHMKHSTDNETKSLQIHVLWPYLQGCAFQIGLRHCAWPSHYTKVFHNSLITAPILSSTWTFWPQDRSHLHVLNRTKPSTEFKIEALTLCQQPNVTEKQIQIGIWDSALCWYNHLMTNQDAKDAIQDNSWKQVKKWSTHTFIRIPSERIFVL